MITTVNALALVTQVSASGYVMPDWRRAERCEIFLDKVVIARTLGGEEADGGFTVVEEHAITISTGIHKIIERAATEPAASTPNGICDGPSKEITAGAALSPLTLFATGGCGSPRIERQGGASSMLLELVRRFCPN